jgi:uracil-DNA glycosylase
MSQKYHNFCKLVEGRYSSRPGNILFGVGNPTARVAVVGFRPDGEEDAVFRGPRSQLIKNAIQGLGVPAHLLWYTYLIKQQKTPEMVLWNEVKPWTELLQQELQIVGCKATILLGVEAAWAMLGYDPPNTEQLRKHRYMLRKLPDTNFFVTYSGEEISRLSGKEDLMTKEGVLANMASDLTAVFKVDESYFKNVPLQ